MPDFETIKNFAIFLPLVIMLLGGAGWLIKTYAMKPQTDSIIKKTDSETENVAATAAKTKLETKKLEIDIQKLIASGDIESVSSFTDNIQELLIFAKNQSLEMIRQQEQHQILVNGLQTQLQEARIVIGEQTEQLKKQATIIEYQREQYEKLSSDWVLTINELNELKEKHTKALKEKAEAIIERDEARENSRQTTKKQKDLEEQVQHLIQTMRDHDIHVSNA